MTAKGSGSRYRTCEVCNTDYHATCTEQRACGRECGNTLSARPLRSAGRSTPILWRQCSECPTWMAKRGRDVCSRTCALARGRRRHHATWVSAAKPTTLPCRECGQPHSTRTATNGGWCKRCRKNAVKGYKTRARFYEVEYEEVNRLTIYTRDKWTCQLCHRKVDRTLQHPHPMARSIDHVVPMSRGGPHTYANVQLAHWQCNVLKGAAGGNEQLALTG